MSDFSAQTKLEELEETYGPHMTNGELPGGW